MGVGSRRRVAFVFRGDAGASPSLSETRLAPIADALAGVELSAEAVVFAEDRADEIRSRLSECAGALVWVDPVTGSDDRSVLDKVLREVAAAGVWVSAHPDVILKMGTKQVLHDTRSLTWGSDVRLYRTPAELAAGLPESLRGGARVLKQHRGNGGIGVWKVTTAGGDAVLVQSARARDESVEEVPWRVFLDRMEKYFAFADGHGLLVDQEFQPRIVDGVIRCYVVGRDVVGFCRQYPAEGASERVFGLPAAKTMFPPDAAHLAVLRSNMETEWIPGMQRLLGIDDQQLPALWDADFLLGRPTADNGDTYVLMEINASAVSPFPPQAAAAVARHVRNSLG